MKVRKKMTHRLTAMLVAMILFATTYSAILASALTVKKLTATGGYITF